MVREDVGLNEKGLWAREAFESYIELQAPYQKPLLIQLGMWASDKRWKVQNS